MCQAEVHQLPPGSRRWDDHPLGGFSVESWHWLWYYYIYHILIFVVSLFCHSVIPNSSLTWEQNSLSRGYEGDSCCQAKLGIGWHQQHQGLQQSLLLKTLKSPSMPTSGKRLSTFSTSMSRNGTEWSNEPRVISSNQSMFRAWATYIAGESVPDTVC